MVSLVVCTNADPTSSYATRSSRINTAQTLDIVPPPASWCSDMPGTQGSATRNVAPVPKRALSSLPLPVSFVDVARDAGLRAPLISGDEQSKKYIIEANGSGVAFIDYDRDGRQDIFLVNGSKLDGFKG